MILIRPQNPGHDRYFSAYDYTVSVSLCQRNLNAIIKFVQSANSFNSSSCQNGQFSVDYDEDIYEDEYEAIDCYDGLWEDEEDKE